MHSDSDSELFWIVLLTDRRGGVTTGDTAVRVLSRGGKATTGWQQAKVFLKRSVAEAAARDLPLEFRARWLPTVASAYHRGIPPLPAGKAFGRPTSPVEASPGAGSIVGP